jgi:hemoglobin/transferrin/lactoferrin receptor protein
MWGAEISNRSKFFSDRWGDVDLTYGLSYLGQDVKLGPYLEFMSIMPPSQGTRDEFGAYGKAAWKPLDWLTLNAGLRYSGFKADGPVQTYQQQSGEYISIGPARNADGFSPSAGITLEPFDGTQFYVNYSSALRLPSLMETIGTFTIVEPGLKPERLNSWDVGINLRRDGLLAANDSAMLKFGWFDWNVKDYISRATQGIDYGSALRIHNIHGAKFSGLELSSRYERGGFTAEFSANYYTNVEYCITADTCGNMSQYGDYATNHVPPKYTVDLTLSQKLLEDRLTVGGRIYYVGSRAADHGDITSQGMSPFITQIQWKPHTLVDVFAEYRISDNYTATLRVENLTDQYYVDPLGLLQQPGPGRTFYANLTGRFGGDQPLPALAPPLFSESGRAGIDWSGFYAGVHGGFLQAHTDGSTGILDAAANTFGGKAAMIAASESANLDFSGGQLGVQSGYNWQFSNRLVAGFEADWGKSWTGGVQDNRAIDDETLAAEGWLQSRTRHDIDWTASIRGRLGYAFDNGLMLYGTAGVAFLRETVTRDQYRVIGQGYSNPGGLENVVSRVEEDSATRVGMTGGLGAEYALNERWSLKGEYAYSGYGSKTYEFARARAGAGQDYSTREVVGTNPLGQPIYKYTQHEGGYKTVNGRQASNSLDLHSFRIGLNYRF